MIANLWFIKHSNGLFYYALEYVEALEGNIEEIWVRTAELGNLAELRFPYASVRILSSLQLIGALVRCRLRRQWLFTPSPHPVPFIARQVVVVHDSYPFSDLRGRLKRVLFRTAMAFSGANAGYINRADSLAFLRKCGIPDKRLHFLPNRLPPPGTPTSPASRVRGARLRVGLFGSDSPKKDYGSLLAAVPDATGTNAIEWRIFGHENAYTRSLQSDFPIHHIVVVPSDATSIDDFVRDIDVAISVARGEGFARPVALSLMNGKPTYLLDTPVFREFYSGSARFFDSPKDVARALLDFDNVPHPPTRLVSETSLREDFAAGLKRIATL